MGRLSVTPPTVLRSGEVTPPTIGRPLVVSSTVLRRLCIGYYWAAYEKGRLKMAYPPRRPPPPLLFPPPPPPRSPAIL